MKIKKKRFFHPMILISLFDHNKINEFVKKLYRQSVVVDTLLRDAHRIAH